MLVHLRSALPLVAFAFLTACADTTSEDPLPTAADHGGAADPSAPALDRHVGREVSFAGGIEQTPGRFEPAPADVSASPSYVGLFLDGYTCRILQMGLSRDGAEWTVSVHAQCRDEVNVAISGRSDVRYPQTDPQPLRAPAVTLELLKGDGRPTTATFSTLTQGSQVRLVNGPSGRDHAPVVGKAILTEEREVHELAFELPYAY